MGGLKLSRTVIVRTHLRLLESKVMLINEGGRYLSLVPVSVGTLGVVGVVKKPPAVALRICHRAGKTGVTATGQIGEPGDGSVARVHGPNGAALGGIPVIGLVEQVLFRLR